MLMITAGQLNKRITIEEVSTAPGDFNEPVSTWSTFVECWAAIEPLSGREAVIGQQVHAQQGYLVRIRYRSGITPKMRVVYGTKTLNIGSVINVMERNEEIQLACTEDA